ncbi:amidohydrolase [Acetobacteraceae bacterium H6797]|nr:amidohydrolase [Acetobacteraceae bacterium H6797]
MTTDEKFASIVAEATEWRRDFHAHPELSFQEYRTSAKVAELLESWGIEVTRNIAGTGLVGTLRAGKAAEGGNRGKAIGLRADMDALPMPEMTGLPYASKTPGVMHACGHDGHTAMLLGAAKYLAETRNFDGTVHFIFQPAEEKGGGGRVMVEEGLFTRFPCDFVYGIHNDSRLTTGHFAITYGTTNAAADTFAIRIHGKGGHAARPHHSIDPVMTAAHVAVALQSVVSRRIDPIESAVLSICMIHGGTATNVIPEEAVLEGTVRTMKAEVRDDMERLLTEVATATAMAHGARAVVEYERGYPSVVNSNEPVDRARRAAAALFGQERVIHDRPPTMGGEDFAYMANTVPGCFIRLGHVDPGTERFSNHHPRYDFNDASLEPGIRFWAGLVEQELVDEQK